MELKIKCNPINGGYCAIFEHDGHEFYADVCDLCYLGFDLPTECMIFNSSNGHVTNWHELYCKRAVPVTEDGLSACIKEFIKQYDEEKNL